VARQHGGTRRAHAGRGGDPALRMKAIGQCHGDRRRTESLSDPPPKVHPFPGPGSSRDQGGTRTDQSPLGSVLRVQRARRGGPWTDSSRPPGSGYELAARSGARRCERRPPSEERGRSNARTVKPPCPPRRSHRFLPPGPNPFPPPNPFGTPKSVRHWVMTCREREGWLCRRNLCGSGLAVIGSSHQRLVCGGRATTRLRVRRVPTALH
jgi:hypothetical protein